MFDFPYDALFWGARQWWPLAVGLATLVALLAIWSYAFRSGRTWFSAAALALKIIAVGLLAFCLLEPMQRSERPKPGANSFAIIVDDSLSMQMKPAGSSASRSESLTPLLDPQSSWQIRLAQDFEVRRYAFAERLQNVKQLQELKFDGKHSTLATALQTLSARQATSNLAGALLFTDGLATDDIASMLREKEFEYPIYPVLDAAESALRDISITQPSVTVSAFELAPANVEATVQAQGLAGRELTALLIDEAGKVLARQAIDCDADRFEHRARFQFQPSQPGFQAVELRVQLSSELPSMTENAPTELTSRLEVTTANNRALMAIDRGGGPYRVLYVAGRPNWEYKFIRRALEEDVELEFHALLRIAKKEPKFSFRDQLVDSANPLRAGFSDDEDTVEQYDEPVLLRIGEGAAEALQAGFPASQESLFHYDAIILDDIEASFFTQPQLLLMREFVAQRGGGLMMLGGQESFNGGEFNQTPLADVLPVYLRDADGSIDPSDKQSAVRYQLTRQGSLEPWLRLRDNRSEEGKRFDEMPNFVTWNNVGGVKPGAWLMAEIETVSGLRPGLAAQRFGNGRTLALMVGDMWRWSMRRAKLETDDLAQSWRQMARWLTNDAPRRVEVKIVAPAAPLDPQRIQVKLRDADFTPLDNAQVVIKITEPDGKQVELSAQADGQAAGLYTTDYWSTTDGVYKCQVAATTPDGQEMDVVRTGWAAQPSAAEFRQVQLNRELLQQLADASGGQIVPQQELTSFAASLPSRKVPITEVRIEPLWHRPWLVACAVFCLCLEWGLRRWKGLA